MIKDRALRVREVLSWRSSGLTADQYARGRPFSGNCLRQWASQLGMVARTTARRRRVVEAILPVRVVPSPSPRSPTPILLEVASARLTLLPGFDRNSLSEILSVLRGSFP